MFSCEGGGRLECGLGLVGVDEQRLEGGFVYGRIKGRSYMGGSERGRGVETDVLGFGWRRRARIGRIRVGRG